MTSADLHAQAVDAAREVLFWRRHAALPGRPRRRYPKHARYYEAVVRWLADTALRQGTP